MVDYWPRVYRYLGGPTDTNLLCSIPDYHIVPSVHRVFRYILQTLRVCLYDMSKALSMGAPIQ